MPELSNDPIIPEIPDLRPDPHILDYFALVARHKWAVSLIVLVSGCLFFAASYCVPYEYQADSMLLPPDRLSSSGMLSGYMSGYAIKILKEVENPSVDLLQNIIESRSMDSRLAEDSLIGGYYRHSTHTQDKLLAIGQQLFRDPHVGIVPDSLRRAQVSELSQFPTERHTRDVFRHMPADAPDGTPYPGRLPTYAGRRTQGAPCGGRPRTHAVCPSSCVQKARRHSRLVIHIVSIQSWPA